MGVSEFFIQKDAKVSFTMVHSWGKEVEVRPRTGITIAEGGSLSNNYILLKPVKTSRPSPRPPWRAGVQWPASTP